MQSRTFFVAMLLGEIALLIKLLIQEETVLFWILVLGQAAFGLALLAINPRHLAEVTPPSKRPALTYGVSFLLIAGALFFHQPTYEKSSWIEVGLFLRGPYLPLLLILSVFVMTILALASVALKGKNGLD